MMHAKVCATSGKILKKLLIGAGIFFGILILSGYLFVHFYFKRTFPNQLNAMVLRCSEGIKVKSAAGQWLPLKPAMPVTKETTFLMPESARSLVSFDGIRLLSMDASEVEVTGSRELSFLKGDVAVESAKRAKPLKISIGTASLSTTDSALNVSGFDGRFLVECFAGTVALSTKKGVKQSLSAGQAAAIVSDNVQVGTTQKENPFELTKVLAIDRIRERFNRIISQYGQARGFNFEKPAVNGTAFRQKHGRSELQFASYVEGKLLRLAQNQSTGSASDYYESLFLPSNRSISIGKQKVVPLDPGKAGTFPRWSHDGSMIAFIETSPNSLYGRARVVRLDDLDNPWDISQEYGDSSGFQTVRPMFPPTWAPDDRHVLFQVQTDNAWDERGQPTGNFALKIAPIDPAEGPMQDFDSPFHDIPLPLPLPVGKTISPSIVKLPWGNAMVCANWGNLAYIPVEEDGQSVANAPGFFLTNFNPREIFIMGGGFSPSGSMMDFTAVKDFDFSHMATYILYDVEDILDGFTLPPRSIDDPRIKQIAPSKNMQFTGGFSFDESLTFFHEDVNHAFNAAYPTMIFDCDFDIFYADALKGEPGKPTQIHLPGNQMFLQASPEGNRLAYCNYEGPNMELRVVSFDIEADMDVDLGGVLIDNSGTNLIVPPGALERNFKVKMSTPFTIKEEAEIPTGESHFFAMRLIDAQGLEKPKFIEPMTLTIRYTDEEVAGLDESMLDIYYYDESDPANPKWVPMGGTVDPEHNEIVVEIKHFSKYAIGKRN